MDSKTALNANRHQAGMSLVQTMMAMGMAGLLMVALASVSIYTFRGIATMSNYVEMDQTARITLDLFTRDCREVLKIKTYTTNSITMVDGDGKDLTYTWSPTAKTLTRTVKNKSTVLLRDCETFALALFRASPQEDVLDLEPTGAMTARALRVSWTCTRKILGINQNSDIEMSSVIVFRPQML